MSIALGFDVNIIEPPPPFATRCVPPEPFIVPSVIVRPPTPSCLTIIVPYSPFLTFDKFNVVAPVKVIS
jgi:hypothetical protein